jgi:hypothetical protein
MSPTVSQDSRLMWQQRIDAQKASELSVSQFCRQHGCSASSFYQWRRKLGSPSPKQATEISVPAALGMGACQQLIPKRPSGPVPSIHLVLGAVGTALTGGPPHRSVRAVLPHTAPTLGVWRESEHGGGDAPSAGAGSSVVRVCRSGSSSTDVAGCDVGGCDASCGRPRGRTLAWPRHCRGRRGNCSTHAQPLGAKSRRHQ